MPPVLSEAEQAIADLDAMTRTCEAAVRDGAAARHKLLDASEHQWQRAMAVLLRAAAQGEDTQVLTASFERLRTALGADPGAGE